MNKLLSTGEMIDKLKVGETAKLHEKHIKGVEDIVYDAVTRDHQGIRWTRSDKEELSDKPLYLNDIVINYVWRILPNYVSFSEAMKAVEEGKDVHCQYNDESITLKSYNNRIGSICFDKHCVGGGGAEIKIAWIVAGKWTIEDDNQ